MDEPQKPSPAEANVPMINVVFLLLIFFLMSATLAPPDALEATPPASNASTPPAQGASLILDASGSLAFQRFRGEVAISAAVAEAGERPLWIRADSRASAVQLVEIIRSARAAGAVEVRLLTVPRTP